MVGVPLAFAAIAAISLSLRPAPASVGPVLGQITASFGVGETAGGILTALPGLCFGLLGMLAVPIARRLGLTGAIAAALVCAALGLLLRPLVGSYVPFVLLSVAALTGPALGNVLVPAWVKRHGGTRAVPLMTLYTMLLTVGAGAGALLAVPLSGPGPEGWRHSLLAWGVLAVIPAVLWLLVLRRTGHDFPPPDPGGELRTSLLRSPTAIALTATFGLQSMTAYVQMGWLPRIYTDAGLSPTAAGALAALVSLVGIVGGLLMPLAAARLRHLSPVLLGLGILTAAGYVGLWLAPREGALLWAILLGIGGFTFAAAIALIPARSRDHLVTARLSGMVQPVGYILAAIGPLLVGAVHEATGSWTVVLWGLTVAALVMGVLGWRASAQHTVDDELAAADRGRMRA